MLCPAAVLLYGRCTMQEGDWTPVDMNIRRGCMVVRLYGCTVVWLPASARLSAISQSIWLHGFWLGPSSFHITIYVLARFTASYLLCCLSPSLSFFLFLLSRLCHYQPTPSPFSITILAKSSFPIDALFRRCAYIADFVAPFHPSASPLSHSIPASPPASQPNNAVCPLQLRHCSIQFRAVRHLSSSFG